MTLEAWFILGIACALLLALLIVHIRTLMYVRYLEEEAARNLEDGLNWERLYHQTRRDTLSGDEWKNDNWKNGGNIDQ